MLNIENSLFWGGWAHCPNYAETATGDVLQKTCPEELRHIYRKALVFELTFNKVVSAILKNNYFEKHLCTTASYYGNLEMFFETICYTE